MREGAPAIGPGPGASGFQKTYCGCSQSIIFGKTRPPFSLLFRNLSLGPLGAHLGPVLAPS